MLVDPSLPEFFSNGPSASLTIEAQGALLLNGFAVYLRITAAVGLETSPTPFTVAMA